MMYFKNFRKRFSQLTVIDLTTYSQLFRLCHCYGLKERYFAKEFDNFVRVLPAMSSELRRQVLKSFKNLHRTRLKIFAGDEVALTAARQKINDEYIKCKRVTDRDSISALLQLSKDVEVELRTKVVQATLKKPGVFEARISSDTLKLDNKPYVECEQTK